jgi:6-carboxyhexanoate--CoA ligase
MRAAVWEHGAARHISGAESIVRAEQTAAACDNLRRRALSHPRGAPDEIHISIERLNEADVRYIPALPVRSLAAQSVAEGRALLAAVLAEAGVPDPAAVLAKLPETQGMRGAMLLDVDTMERLESDPSRGIRLSRMDALDGTIADKAVKNHFREALVLATKAAHAPGIIAEICISDDPDYQTGYAASQTTGYVRISPLKELGDSFGGRILLFRFQISDFGFQDLAEGGGRGEKAAVDKCVEYLQFQPVLVTGVPEGPGGGVPPSLQPRGACLPLPPMRGAAYSTKRAYRPLTAQRGVKSLPEAPRNAPAWSVDTAVQGGKNAPIPCTDGEKWDGLRRALDEKKERGLYRTVPLMESAPGPFVTFGGRTLTMLASNNYLDLAGDPRLAASAKEAAERYGCGSGGSRLTTGTTPPHIELEQRLAAWKGTEAALLFSSGYLANMGVISALCAKNWVILSDEKNHASIIDGCRLSGARIVVYRHNDTASLEEKAADCFRQGFTQGLIVSDGVFSMDGDIADLPCIAEIAARFGYFWMIDEAHSGGVMGATGRGLCEHFNIHPDIITGTCSKALGGEGGFVCGSRLLVDYLVNHARSFIFSTSYGPAAAAAAACAVSILQSEPERVEKLRANTAFFCRLLTERGLPAFSQSAIVPIKIGSEEDAVAASKALLAAGCYIPAIRYPTVAKGEAILRAALSSGHDKASLIHAADVIAEVVIGRRGGRHGCRCM